MGGSDHVDDVTALRSAGWQRWGRGPLVVVIVLALVSAGWWLSADRRDAPLSPGLGALPGAAGVAADPATVPATVAAGVGQNGEIEYLYPEQSVWTTRTSPNGAPDNPLLPVAAGIFDAAGLAWHPAPFPAARMFSQIEKRANAFSILVRSPALDACCIWGRTPIARTELRAYHLPEKQQIRDRHDLIGKRIATIRGYGYGGLKAFLGDPVNRIAVNAAGDHGSAFGMLARGHVDYVLDYAGPAAEVLAGLPRLDLQADAVDTLDAFMVLSRQYPDAESVMARLDIIAARMVAGKPPGPPASGLNPR